MNKDFKICFVCTGNTCRSIMAERISKKKIKKENFSNIKFFSKGLSAKGDNITQNAKIVLKEIGCCFIDRKSVQLKRIDKSMLYVVMKDEFKSQILGKVISVKDLIGEDVLDPFGKDLQTYRMTRDQLVKIVDVLLEKIVKIRGGK